MESKNKKEKIAIITVPYVTNNELFSLMDNSYKSLISEQYELIHIVVINKYCYDINYFVKNDKFNVVLENSENCLAAAWNIGIREAIEQKINKIIIPNLDILADFKTIDDIANKLNHYDFVCGNENGGLESVGSPKTLKIFLKNSFSFFGLNTNCIKKVGYFDENFKPAYFEDDDYKYRLKINNINYCTSVTAFYTHFGSQTIGKDIELAKYNNSRYALNSEYYIKKWGGKPGEEKYNKPFNMV